MHSLLILNKTHPGLAKAGLKVIENAKMYPRLIIHNVPVEMTREEIVDDIIAQPDRYQQNRFKSSLYVSSI